MTWAFRCDHDDIHFFARLYEPKVDTKAVRKRQCCARFDVLSNLGLENISLQFIWNQHHYEVRIDAFSIREDGFVLLSTDNGATWDDVTPDTGNPASPYPSASECVLTGTHLYVAGKDGNDLIRGGAGKDRLYGQDGNDFVTGGFDNDVIMGGAGDDRLLGNDEQAAGLEITATGPTLDFDVAARICLTGADFGADPGFQGFVRGGFGDDVVHGMWRQHRQAIAVAQHNVSGQDGNPGDLHGVLRIYGHQAPVDAHLVIVGLCMAKDTFFPAKAIVKELRITFAFVYSKSDFQFVIDMLGSERIPADALVTSVIGLDDFPHKFEALRSPGADLKVMLEPGFSS